MGAGSQPHVLHGAGTTPHVGVGEGVASQHPRRRGATIAGHDDADRGLADPLELEVEKPGATIRGQQVGLTQSLPVGHDGGAIAGVGVAHHDEPPRLAVTDTGGAVASPQDGIDEVFGDVVVAVTTDVTAGVDGGVEPLLHLVTQGPPSGISGASG